MTYFNDICSLAIFRGANNNTGKRNFVVSGGMKRLVFCEKARK